eukprot:Em0059g7a
MEKYLAPEPIGEGDLHDQWRRFKREFTQFLTAVGKGSADEKVKLAMFLRTVGPRVNDMYETMRFEEGEDSNSFKVVVGKLDNACARRTSKHIIRDKFFQLKQEGKSIDHFVMEMRKQVNDCQFGELKDDLMLHVLIRGVDSDRMRRRLFETERLDLTSAIRMCQTMESTANDLQLLTATKPTESEESVAALGVKDGEERLRPEESNRENTSKRGFSQGARRGPGDRGRNRTIVCQLDTAASCNVLAASDYRRLGSPGLGKSQTTLTMYDGTVRRSMGRWRTQVYNRQEELTWDYEDVFTGVGCLQGEYDMVLDQSIPPVQNGPRKITHVMRRAVTEKLQAMEKDGLITRVDTPTPWISNLTAVWKPDKVQVRVCLDPRDLNTAIKRNHFHMPTLDDVLPTLNKAKVFCLLDVKDGFMHIKLTERSSFLTTFWGPQGRYRWLRLPFGISSAPEEFQRRLQAALHGIDGVAVVADDVLVYGTGEREEEARRKHDEALVHLLRRARQCNIKFNKQKLRLHMSELLYIGHQISKEGVRPDPAKVRAIKGMAAPESASDVRRFLGMCNYLSRFIHNLSQASEPLRRLTEGEAEFHWGPTERAAFEEVKSLISTDQTLTFYDVAKPVVIQCDASTKGLGATLLQEGRPIASASRSLSKSEKNYVAIELECLAIVFACRKFDQYIYGKKTRVETDHKPLEVITKKSILVAPRRLQRMLLSLQRYDLDIKYCPGEQQVIADTLSRLPAEVPKTEELTRQEVFQLTMAEQEARELEVIDEREFLQVRDQRLVEIQKAAMMDLEQKTLMQVITQGWPTTIQEAPILARKYWNFRETLTVQDGLIYKGGQVVVPESRRADCLTRLHASHMGSESTLRRARDALYWPNMAKDIISMTAQCRACEEDGIAQPTEEYRAHAIPKLPWGKVGMDLFQCKGRDYLIIVDYLTDFFEVSNLSNTLAVTVVQAAKRQFSRHGIPLVVQTDGGPQFMSSEFQAFAKSWDFQHTVSSPYHSQSNGKAEAAVKIAKRIFKRSSDPYLALLEWRNTPTVGLGASPCQRLFSRRTRGAVPTSSAKLKQEPQVKMWEKKTGRQRQIQAQQSGKGHRLPPLQYGEPVLVQDLRASKTKWLRGRCVDQLTERSYTVDVDGQLVHRNRQFIRPSSHVPEHPVGEDLVDDPRETGPEHPRDSELRQQAPSSPQGVQASSQPAPSSPPIIQASNQPVDPTRQPRTTRSGRVIREPERFRNFVKL